MRQADPIPPSLRRAYRVFIEELNGHVEETVRFFGEQPEGVVNDLNSIRVGFHKIKGGAGFFGLSEIARISKEIEHLLGRAGDVAEHQAELLVLVATLQSEASRLSAFLESDGKED